MKNLLCIALLFQLTSLQAQYFYKDIIGSKEITSLMKSYHDNKVKKITAVGLDAQGITAKDYSEEQEVSEEDKMLKISTLDEQKISTISYRFDNMGRLINSIDFSNGLKSTTDYTYDNDGRIWVIKNAIIDSANNFNQTEIHQWFYKLDKTEKMLRIINSDDSLEVRFKNDENGNITEEQNFKHGNGADPVYYYYDDKKRMTDIVRYNKIAKKLLPDYMFEYDDKDRVIQKITTLSNLNLGYLTWRYLYNEKGLKTKEALFNKEKKLQGKIEYTYQ